MSGRGVTGKGMEYEHHRQNTGYPQPGIRPFVGGFLVIDYATRTNWKKEYEKLQSEMTVARHQHQCLQPHATRLVTQKKRADADRDDALQKFADREIGQQGPPGGSTAAKPPRPTAAPTTLGLSAEKAIAEKDRLKAENKALAETVQERDGRIATLQEKAKKYRQEAIAADTKAKATQERNDSLAQANRRITAVICSARRRREAKTQHSYANPNSPNPPPNDIKGKIEKVDPTDRTLVTVSLGSDQGLQVHHTLEVYRLAPTPQYLGMIRIEDVREHVAVGKLVRNGVAGNRILATGRHRGQQSEMIVEYSPWPPLSTEPTLPRPSTTPTRACSPFR